MGGLFFYKGGFGLICEECGMRNKTRKCSLCGHISNQKFNKSKSSSDTIMDKISKFWTPTPSENPYNRVVRIIQITLVVIMIINVLPVLYYTSFFDDFSWWNIQSTSNHKITIGNESFDSSDIIDTSTTSIHEGSKLIQDYISDYVPDKINKTGWEEFYMPLFGTEYEVEAEISCYSGEWYGIFIPLYDVDNEEVDSYLRDLFVEYGGEYIEFNEEYQCEIWQFNDGISIELYFNKYIDYVQYYSSMFIKNDNWYIE